MDIREVPAGEFNRHPWEISKAKKITAQMSRFLKELHQRRGALRIVNIGAGDMYFDREYLKRFPADKIWAVDIEYKQFESGHDHILMAKELGALAGLKFDAAVLMNVLEYIPDEVCFLRELLTFLQPGAVIIFVLPAIQYLFSEHDVYVKGLRRYSHKTFHKIINETPGVETLASFYFYSTLFTVRAVKRLFKIPTDTDQRKVPMWKYPAGHIITKALTAMLDLDFFVWRLLQKTGLKLPGLSLFAVCRINRDGRMDSD